jgi:hypothetical protein
MVAVERAAQLGKARRLAGSPVIQVLIDLVRARAVVEHVAHVGQVVVALRILGTLLLLQVRAG